MSSYNHILPSASRMQVSRKTIQALKSHERDCPNLILSPKHPKSETFLTFQLLETVGVPVGSITKMLMSLGGSGWLHVITGWNSLCMCICLYVSLSLLTDPNARYFPTVIWFQRWEQRWNCNVFGNNIGIVMSGSFPVRKDLWMMLKELGLLQLPSNLTTGILNTQTSTLSS